MMNHFVLILGIIFITTGCTSTTTLVAQTPSVPQPNGGQLARNEVYLKNVCGEEIYIQWSKDGGNTWTKNRLLPQDGFYIVSVFAIRLRDPNAKCAALSGVSGGHLATLQYKGDCLDIKEIINRSY